MKNNPSPKLALLLASVAATSAVQAQTLFSDNFDVNSSSSWTVNNNGNGLNAANFFFDYSAVGIPSAPNSIGGTTIGLKLGANLGGSASTGLAGISVSPTGLSLSGNYTLKFDWWHNWLGSSTTGIGSSSGGSGSTQLSTFGILTSGTVANYAGVSDSVFFSATGDGASGSDYRIYSSEDQNSYDVGESSHATYDAGSRNNTASLYTTLFPGGVSAPAAQVTISSTQSGTTLPGTSGFAWNEVEIEKSGNLVTWSINGTQIASVDTTDFTVATGGNNILFGMADTSTGAGTPANLFEQLDFTLIDNIDVQVTPVPEPAAFSLIALGAGALALARRRKV